MKIICPDYENGVCSETRCGRVLSNPRPDGVDENGKTTYTAACVFDGVVKYFYGLRTNGGEE